MSVLCSASVGESAASTRAVTAGRLLRPAATAAWDAVGSAAAGAAADGLVQV
jgi:hypothetical protein